MAPDRIALDTNILAYAEAVNGEERRLKAWSLLAALEQEHVFVPVQVLGELFALLIRKANVDPAEARDSVLDWSRRYEVVDTSSAALTDAMDLVIGHRLSFWDAVILAAASESRCRYLLSEDMQHGFVWGGVTVRNPFRE